MLDLCWLLPALPFAGFLVLATVGGRLPRRAVAWIGAGSVGLSFLVALLLFAGFSSSPGSYLQRLWTWVDAGSFRPQISLRLDPLSLVMVLIVTGVGFLIHVY